MNVYLILLLICNIINLLYYVLNVIFDNIKYNLIECFLDQSFKVLERFNCVDTYKSKYAIYKKIIHYNEWTIGIKHFKNLFKKSFFQLGEVYKIKERVYVLSCFIYHDGEKYKTEKNKLVPNDIFMVTNIIKPEEKPEYLNFENDHTFVEIIQGNRKSYLIFSKRSYKTIALEEEFQRVS